MRFRTSMFYLLAISLLSTSVFTACSEKEEYRYDEPEVRTQPRTQPAPQPETTMRERVTTDGRTSLAFPTGYEDSSVLLIEVDTPSEVMQNDEFDYEITVTNLTDELSLRNVRIIEEVPGAFTVTSSDPAMAGGNMQPSRDRQNAMKHSYYIGTLEPGESETILVSATVGSTDAILACMTAQYEQWLCWEAEVINPAIAIEKRRTSPETALLCEDITYEVTVRNTGTGPAEDIVVRDEFVQGLSADGESVGTYEIGTIEQGESETITITAQASQAGQYPNVVTAEGANVYAESAPVNVTIVQPELVVTKTVSPRDYIGVEYDYSIVVTNVGDGPAQDTVVRDDLPDGVSFVSASNGGELEGDTVVWDLGTLQPNQSASLTVTATGESKGRQCNTVTASAYCADDATAEACIELVGIPAVLLEVIDERDPIKVGQEEIYEIRVTNQGSQTEENIRIEAQLENMTFVGIEGPTDAVADGDVIKVAPLAELEPKETATWRIRATADAEGDVRFRVEMITNFLTRPVRETESTNIYRAGNIRGAAGAQPVNP